MGGAGAEAAETAKIYNDPSPSPAEMVLLMALHWKVALCFRPPSRHGSGLIPAADLSARSSLPFGLNACLPLGAR